MSPFAMAFGASYGKLLMNYAYEKCFLCAAIIKASRDPKSSLDEFQQDAYASTAEKRPAREIGFEYVVKIGTVINERGYGGMYI
jgi:hypothetical protein